MLASLVNSGEWSESSETRLSSDTGSRAGSKLWSASQDIENPSLRHTAPRTAKRGMCNLPAPAVISALPALSASRCFYVLSRAHCRSPPSVSSHVGLWRGSNPRAQGGFPFALRCILFAYTPVSSAPAAIPAQPAMSASRFFFVLSRAHGRSPLVCSHVGVSVVSVTRYREPQSLRHTTPRTAKRGMYTVPPPLR